MARKGGLGKGLDALFSEAQFDAVGFEEKNGGITMLRLSDIEPDKNQPRKTFDTEALSSLADSISFIKLSFEWSAPTSIFTPGFTKQCI